MTEIPKKIVVIDDNEAISSLLMDLLEDMSNYQVVGQAFDGKSGIELIQDTRPDVVILDLCMPYIDGLGVMEAFQEDKSNYFPKFIITSCVGQEHITLKAMKLGAVYYIIKPFDFDYFKNRLNELAEETVTSPLEDFLREGYGQGQKQLNNKVSELLQALGVPPHTKGYAYLREGIVLVSSDMKYMNKITKNLYPKIAEIYESTPSRVERAIRNSIELTLEQGDHDSLVRIFGHRIKDANNKLTNSEFISIISEKLKVGQ